MKRRTGQDRSTTDKWGAATQAVRGGTARSEYGETSEAIFLTSGYSYDCAGDAAARFAGDQVGMTYSRLQNPTSRCSNTGSAMLEGAEACRTMASGMAAMTAVAALPASGWRSHGRRSRGIRLLPLADRYAAAEIRDQHRHRRCAGSASVAGCGKAGYQGLLLRNAGQPDDGRR